MKRKPLRKSSSMRVRRSKLSNHPIADNHIDSIERTLQGGGSSAERLTCPWIPVFSRETGVAPVSSTDGFERHEGVL